MFVENFERAVLNLLRKRVTDPASRGTSTSDSFDGDTSTLLFTLTNKPLMFITSVVVDGVTKRLLEDFNIDFGGSVDFADIIFLSGKAPGNGTNNVVVTYTHGSNWIFPDEPSKKATYPRISIKFIGGGEDQASGSSKVRFKRPVLKISVWCKADRQSSFTINSQKYSGDKLDSYLNTQIAQAAIDIEFNQEIFGLIELKTTEPNKLGIDKDYGIVRSTRDIIFFWRKDYG